MVQDANPDQPLPLEEIFPDDNQDIDVEEVMNRIQRRIRTRYPEAETADLTTSNGTASFPWGKELNHNMRQLQKSHNNIGARLILTDSRLPIIGPVWQKIRRSFHYLVLFYLNMVVRNQVKFNKYVVWTLLSLMKELVTEKKQMQEQLEALQERVTALERDAEMISEQARRG